jgi:hypothetical protein
MFRFFVGTFVGCLLFIAPAIAEQKFADLERAPIRVTVILQPVNNLTRPIQSMSLPTLDIAKSCAAETQTCNSDTD